MSNHTCTYTYWDAGPDGLGVAITVVPEGDDPPTFVTDEVPEGITPITVEEAMTILCDSGAQSKAQHDATEASKVAQRNTEIAERDAHVAEVVATGVSQAAAEAMFPTLPAYTPAPFFLQGGWEQHLAKAYGLTAEQIAQVRTCIEES